jgi:hypothetical protein
MLQIISTPSNGDIILIKVLMTLVEDGKILIQTIAYSDKKVNSNR